jgi:hypothetical protein
MSRYYKASYEKLFPPFKAFICHPDGTMEEDVGQYSAYGRRIIAPSEPGVVIANNQYYEPDALIKVNCTDGVSSISQTLKVGPIQNHDWTIVDNVATSARRGVRLTYSGPGLLTSPYNIFFKVVTPENDNVFYDQVNSQSWIVAPVGGCHYCYMTIFEAAPAVKSQTYIVPYSCGCYTSQGGTHCGTCYAFPQITAIQLKVQAINRLNNEVLGTFILSYLTYSADVHSVNYSWDY